MSNRPAPTDSPPSFSNDDLPKSRPPAKTLLLIAGVVLGAILLPGLIVLVALVVVFR
jgi:hypothetical protein